MRKQNKQKITIEYRPSLEAEGFEGTAVLREILQTGAVFVCLELAALWMLADVFNELTISFQYLFQMCMAFFLLIIAAKIADALARRHHMAVLGKYVLPLMYAAGALWYGIKYQEYLFPGGGAVVSSVLQKFNIYYGTSYLVLQQSEDKRELALIYVFFVLFLLVLTQALAMRRRIFLIIPPVLVLVLEMLVGRTPQIRGILLLFIGVLLLGWGNWEDRNAAHSTERPGLTDELKGLIFPALLCLATVICMTALSPLAVRLAAAGEQVKVYQARLESQVGRLFENARLNNQSTVTNLAPEYTYEEVFTVSVSRLGSEDLYLRGFYGTDYLNGNWSDTTAEFDTVYANSNYSELNIVNIAGYTNLNKTDTLTIRYTAFDTTTVFVPYLVSADSLENCVVTGDYVVRKSKDNTEISFNYRNTDIVELVAYLDLEESASQDAQQWYAEYVMEHYLDVPETVTSAKTIANGLLDGNLVTYSEDATESMYTPVLSGLLSAAAVEDATTNTINLSRIVAAELVQAYLQQWTYSLNLNKDTKGKDIIEYFMYNSHKGYCVHYATAAALILREMGVPARYVSGYRVNRETFVKDGDIWTASVTDDKAHAWVEVYLNGVGWVPFEVSPQDGAGGNSQAQSTDLSDVTQSGLDASENTENENSESGTSETESTGWENTNSESENGDSMDTEGSTSENSENGSEDIESQLTEAQNQLSELMENATENSEAIADLQNRLAALQEQQQLRDEEKKTQQREKLLRMLRIAGAIMLVIAVIAVLIRAIYVISVRKQKQWLLRLQRDLKNRHNRHAITSLNAKIYRILRRKAGMRLHQPSDPEYAKLLTAYFSQEAAAEWNRYVDIVQKAAFSQEDMSDEEADFCYRMYHSIIKKQ